MLVLMMNFMDVVLVILFFKNMFCIGRVNVNMFDIFFAFLYLLLKIMFLHGFQCSLSNMFVFHLSKLSRMKLEIGGHCKDTDFVMLVCSV